MIALSFGVAASQAAGYSPALLEQVVESNLRLRDELWGNVTAVDYNTGKIRWQVKTAQPMIGGILATAGGLVFTGEGNGLFKAYDSESGSLLWQFQAGAGVNAPPSSYTVDGQQYVVVGAGGNTQLDYKRGNSIVAFTLAP